MTIQNIWDERVRNAERGANAGGLSWVRRTRSQKEPSAIVGFYLNMIMELRPNGMVYASVNGSRGAFEYTGINDDWNALKVRAEGF